MTDSSRCIHTHIIKLVVHNIVNLGNSEYTTLIMFNNTSTIT